MSTVSSFDEKTRTVRYHGTGGGAKDVGMEIIRDIGQMDVFSRRTVRQGRTIGFVPTMGSLHEGHLSLMRTARQENDIVVVSIFVNPLQFGQNDDFDAYPRDFERDEAMVRQVGVDVLFYPESHDMYRPGYLTYVTVEKLTDGLCGASRPGHFKGVTTVVAKLFSIIRPDRAYFGQKDAQQALVIIKMADDLDMGVEIRMLPIVREPDGLAMSSRNMYLSVSERRDAVVLSGSIRLAQSLVEQGERDPAVIIAAMRELIAARPSVRVDYISIVDTKDLRAVPRITDEALVAVAVYIGTTRLIDNTIVKV